jgi:glycosyltransferase involved in cell wall biosynthesis
MKVSLVCTLLNEASGLDDLLTSIDFQTRLPDEWIIVDGGSTDGTRERLQAFASQAPFHVTILQEPGCNIARGRNLAIGAASHPVIAVCDGGCRYDARWLAALVSPIENQSTSAVAGWYEPDARTPFERRVALATFPRLDRVDPERFLPSARSVAFLKTVWEEVGGYPEVMRLTGEDTAFDTFVLASGHRFVFQPGAVAFWRPRRTYKAFWNYVKGYGFGDGEGGHGTSQAREYALRLGGLVSAIIVWVVWPKLGWCAAVPLLIMSLYPALRWPLRDRLHGLFLLPTLWSGWLLGFIEGRWKKIGP